MKRDRDFEELLDKVKDISSPVKPELWGAIQSQIVGTSILGMSAATAKLVIGTAFTTILVGGVVAYQMLSSEDLKVEQQISKVDSKEVVTDTLTSQAEPFQDNKVVNSNIEEQGSITQPKLVEKSSESGQQVRSHAENLVPDGMNSQGPEPLMSIAKNQAKTEDVAVQPRIAEEKTIKNNIKKFEPAVSAPESDNSTRSPEVSWGELPNVFTPNGDGRNDVFFVNVENIKDFALVVLDEKGNTVWRASESSEQWDGRLPSGEMASKGGYVYYITGLDLNGKSVSEYRRLYIK